MKDTNELLDGIRAMKQDSPCVSIYLHKPGARLAENLASIELYRELAYARRLLESSLPSKAAADYLRPIWGVAKDELLSDSGGTLALFQSGDVSACVRLPEALQKRTVVATDFHVKPLVRENARVAQDTLSRRAVDFREANAQGLTVSGLFAVGQALKRESVDRIWVAEDVTIWGLLSRRHGTVVLHPEQLNDRDGDVLDDLAEWAIDQGAEVLVLPRHQIPGHEPVVAQLKSKNVRKVEQS